MAAGSWATSEDPVEVAEAARLRLVGGSHAELPEVLEDALSPTLVVVDGTPATPRRLLEAFPQEGHFLLWLSSPLRGVEHVGERLRALEVRHELEVELVRGESGGEPARRWFSLWHLPEDLPLVAARSAVRDPDGSTVRARFLGPRDGHPLEGGGWRLPTQEILRPRPRPMPEAMRQAVGPRPAAPAPGEPVGWRLVSHGDRSGAVRKPGRRVLRDPAEVGREWQRLHQGLLGGGAPPDLDPGREVLVALYQGRLDAPTARREVVGVWQSDQALVVGVRDGNAVAGAGTSPYVWIRAEASPGMRVEVRPLP